MNAAPAGLLPVDKPAGPTSHDVVARARRVLGTRRVGHAGTLDPFATGLLLLVVGWATRLAEYLSGLEKTYEATVRLGSVTDTDDSTGTIVATHDHWRDITPEEIASAAAGLVGEIDQVPPAYSAKKRGGERAYARARRGEHVALEPVRVVVRELRVLSVALPDVEVAVRCSAGTYVRALGRDLGERLGVGGHVHALRRTAIGPLRVEDAVTLASLDGADATDAAGAAGAAGAAERLLDPLVGLGHLVRFELDVDEEARLLHGQSVETGAREVPPDGPVLAVREGRLVSVGRVEENRFRPSKVFPAEGRT